VCALALGCSMAGGGGSCDSASHGGFEREKGGKQYLCWRVALSNCTEEDLTLLQICTQGSCEAHGHWFEWFGEWFGE